MLPYFASTMYHALPVGRAKRVFNTLDHSAIYLFIAGSYTPFALGALRGGWGWTLFGLVWGIAAIGVVLKSFNRLRHQGWSTGLYVAMRWLVLIAAAPLIRHVAVEGLLWLLAGGLAYTAGAVVFMFDSTFRYAHFVWHLFVVGGSTCHFCAPVRFVAVCRPGIRRRHPPMDAAIRSVYGDGGQPLAEGTACKFICIPTIISTGMRGLRFTLKTSSVSRSRASPTA
jgi:hemolysin III